MIQFSKLLHSKVLSTKIPEFGCSTVRLWTRHTNKLVHVFSSAYRQQVAVPFYWRDMNS